MGDKSNLLSSTKNFVRLAFTVLLFFGGAYLIEKDINVYFGLILVGWSFLRVFKDVRAAYTMPLERSLLDAVSESRAATKISISLKVDGILGHHALGAAFERLKGLGRLSSEVTIEQWRQTLLEKFRKQEGLLSDDPTWAKVEFDIRSGQLWVDGDYRQNSIIYHAILIPDESLENPYAGRDGLTIRIFVLNGQLVVQVGEWEEEDGRREEWQKDTSWIAWDTVTEFPLLLCPLVHYIPPRFLLLDIFANSLDHPNWERMKASYFERVENYRRVLGAFGEPGEEELRKRQLDEFKSQLAKEGYKWSM